MRIVCICMLLSMLSFTFLIGRVRPFMFRPSVATFSTRVQKVTQHIGANSAASQAASIKGTESEKMNEVQVPNVKKRIKGKIPSPAKTDDLNGKQARKTVKVEEMTIPGKSLAKSDDYVAFEVYGEPIALQRHRVLRSGISYNPSSKQQKQFLDSSTPFLPSVPFEGPLEMRVAFYFKRPLNHYGSGKNSHVLKPGMEIWHSKRKDVDNLVKFVLDALNKVAYQDDGQVSVLSTAKLYTEGPARVLVQIRRLGERDLLFGDHFGLAEARSGVSEGVIQPAQQQQQEQAQAPTTIRS